MPAIKHSRVAFETGEQEHGDCFLCGQKGVVCRMCSCQEGKALICQECMDGTKLWKSFFFRMLGYFQNYNYALTGMKSTRAQWREQRSVKAGGLHGEQKDAKIEL